MDARVNVTMPKEFLNEVDREAKLERRSRSELIREALRYYMAVPARGRSDRRQRQRAIEVAGRQDRLAAKIGSVDVVGEIRKMRRER